MPLRRRLLLALPLAGLAPRGAALAASPAEIWPGTDWAQANPAQAGWSADKLALAHRYAGEIGTASLLIVQHGRIVDSLGDIAGKHPLHSVRKSLLSALIGIAVAAGQIDLGATLGGLGIDDVTPALTAAEKQATVRDLLEARSGVYHPALYETAGEQRLRPPRGSHRPGTFWYYNNWDFNVLGTIYERAAGASVFESFQRHIATPTGMQDYRPADGHHLRGAASRYPAYLFRMSARDLARFGLLYLRGGAWRTEPIVPAAWVKDSTTGWSVASAASGKGYGYLWWVALPGSAGDIMDLPKGGFWADGHRGQFILVDPTRDLVVVHQTATASVDDRKMGRLMGLILAAAPI